MTEWGELDEGRIGPWEVFAVVITFPVSVPVILAVKLWHRFCK